MRPKQCTRSLINQFKPRTALGLFCLGLGLASPASYADEFSYNYADIAFITSDGFSGARGRGSFEFLDDFRAIGELAFAGDNGVDLTTFSIGAGYIFRFNEQTNVVVDAGFSHAEVEFGGFDADASDFFARGSLRYEVAPDFEVEPSIGFLLGDTDELTLGVEGRYWFADQWAAQIEISGDTGPSDATFAIGVRWDPRARK